MFEKLENVSGFRLCKGFWKGRNCFKSLGQNWANSGRYSSNAIIAKHLGAVCSRGDLDISIGSLDYSHLTLGPNMFLLC